MLHGLYWLTVSLAGPRPLAFVVDDAHWADAPSLRFLAYLANRIDELPVLLVAGARPFEPGAELELLDALATHDATRLIRPAALTPTAADALISSVLGAQADPEFTTACFEETKGNPLLLHELLATLAAEGLEPTAAHTSALLELAPQAVARPVARRLRGLSAEARALARALAVLGAGGGLAAAARLAGLDGDQAANEARVLQRADILETGALEFVHPVVRAAVYSEHSAPERARAHRAAADVLGELRADEDAIALHLLASEPAGDGWVVVVLRRAARRAHSRGAPDVAATYLARALAEPPAAGERVDILIELGQAALAANRISGLDRMREALALADEPVTRARIALELGKSLFAWGSFGDAVYVLEAALARLGPRDPELHERLEGLLLAARLPVTALRSPEYESRVLALVDESAELSDPVVLATVAAAASARIKPAARVAAIAERALAGVALSIEDDTVVLAMAGFALLHAGRLDKAKQVWDRAIEEARRRGLLYATGFASTMRAFVLVRLGEVAKAEADGRGTLELLGRAPFYGLPFVLTSLTDALLERREPGEASRLLEDYGFSGELPDIFGMNNLLESRGRLRVAQGRMAQGLADLRECGRRHEDAGILNPGLLPWRASLATALLAAGERDEALALANEEVEAARAFEVPRELGMALRAAGLAEGGHAGVERLSEAVMVLQAAPARLEHARALTDLGAALRRLGRRATARERLREGLDLAQRCGATVLAARAYDELVATGARPRRLLLSGVDALTPSERRIAEMATEQLTNREIAQALFITEKTVEGHLGHVYRKLDISSRLQLEQAMGRCPDPVED
jgi:DNA-binding CsgD family transcriptional regulator/Flp pilus assembly protein TadD